MPTPKTPFGVTVETPPPTSSPNFIDPPEPVARETEIADSPPPRLATEKAPSGHGTSGRPIRLRYKGHSFQDIEKMRRAAHELEAKDDYERAKDKFCELLDVSKHLLAEGAEMYRNVVYEVACFFARNEDMETADNVLDSLSEECIRSWGAVHENTLNHYATVGKFLVQWDRHSDAVGIFQRMAETLPVLASPANKGPKPGLTSQPGAFHSYIDVDNQPMQDSIHATVEEHVEKNPSHTLAALQQRLKLSRDPTTGGEGFSEEALSQLLSTMEQNPAKNAANIIHAHCLLITYFKANMPDRSGEALATANDRAISLCKQNVCLSTTFYHTCIQLANTFFEAEQQSAAQQLLHRLQAKFTNDYGPDHPDTISLLIRIGKIMQRQTGRWELARQWLEAAYAGALERFGVQSALAKRLEACLENGKYSFEPDEDEESAVFSIVTL